MNTFSQRLTCNLATIIRQGSISAPVHIHLMKCFDTVCYRACPITIIIDIKWKNYRMNIGLLKKTQFHKVYI